LNHTQAQALKVEWTVNGGQAAKEADWKGAGLNFTPGTKRLLPPGPCLHVLLAHLFSVGNAERWSRLGRTAGEAQRKTN
jgi:hypothetical protein